MDFVMTPYLWIGRKPKESKEIDPFGQGKFAEIRRRISRIDQLFCPCHREQAGPKGDRR